MWTVKKTLLEDLMDASKKYYPDEFMCFLSGDKKSKLIKEVVLLPNTSGKDFASIQESVIPIDDDIIGSVHSHPTGQARPSQTDKKLFMKYAINLIVSISEYKIGFFDSRGAGIEVNIT